MTKKAPWWDRLNAALLPKIGPPPLGPYNEAPLPPTGAKPCPVCGLPMSEHRIERGVTGDARTATRIHCPTADEHRAFVLADSLAVVPRASLAVVPPAAAPTGSLEVSPPATLAAPEPSTPVAEPATAHPAAHPAAHTSSKG